MRYASRKLVQGIPSGQASDKQTEGALVIEGGAFRNLYSQGVCDALMEADLNFSCIVGLSAGAMTGFIYDAGAIGAAARFNLLHRRDPWYVGLPALIDNNGIIGFRKLYQGLGEYGYQRERMVNSGKRLVAVATDCRTGMPAYFEKGKVRSIYRGINASASMPVVSKMLPMEGGRYLDGICSGNIPVEWAMDQGYQKILVLCSREREFRKPIKKKGLSGLYQFWYRNYPALQKSLKETDEKYNQKKDQLDEWEKEGRIFMIAPSKPVTVSHLEPNLKKLRQLYDLGYQDGKSQIKALQAYLHK